MKSMLKNWLKAFLVVAACRGFGYAEDIKFSAGGNDFILPFQQVQAVQLYSFDEGKGFPGAETVLVSRGRSHVSFGAAPVLGTNVNVPFLSVSTRLTERLFDTNDNELFFGAWVGRASKGKDTLWGISCSTKLW